MAQHNDYFCSMIDDIVSGGALQIYADPTLDNAIYLLLNKINLLLSLFIVCAVSAKWEVSTFDPQDVGSNLNSALI